MNYLKNKLKLILVVLFAGIFVSLGLAVYSQICMPKDIEFNTYKNGVYVVNIDSDYFAKNSDIYISKTLETVEDAAQKNKAKIAINAGFFDPNNQKTTSYILKNNEILENPQNNERLIQSEELKPYLETIFNRAEFRVLSCPVDKVLQSGDITRFEIANHNDPLPPQKTYSLVYSIQAGPELVPNFDLEDEFFVLKKEGKVVRESASALQKVARSAIGIKKDRILLVAISNQCTMTLEELADFMKSLGVEKAMAFDGGSSTSLYLDYNLLGFETDKEKFILNSAKDNAARRVKSVLFVK